MPNLNLKIDSAKAYTPVFMQTIFFERLYYRCISADPSGYNFYFVKIDDPPGLILKGRAAVFAVSLQNEKK